MSDAGSEAEGSEVEEVENKGSWLHNIVERCPYCASLAVICKPCLVLKQERRCTTCCKRGRPEWIGVGDYV